MSNKFRQLLQPQYVSQFHCIGSACEDSCCIGWRVQIDKDTYKRYRDCSDSNLRDQMDEKVKRHRTNPTDGNYAKIKLNPDGHCPFIDEDKLCAIQRKLGEEYLSVTCTTYPRISNNINGVTEKSLTMSCPEAARKALLNPSLMEFDECEEAIAIRNTDSKHINTSDIKMAHKPQRYFWEVRIFIITLLQNRDYSLWQRLVILGLFCRSLDQLVAETKVHEIPALIGTYQNQIDAGAFREELNKVPTELTLQMELMKEIADERIFSGVNSQRFLECFGEFLHGIQYVAEAKKEEIGRCYADAYEQYYRPYMAEHEYMLENYLVNYVFKNLFPTNGEKHIFDNFVILTIHYAMIKLLLIGMAGFHKEQFADDHVIKLIQSFSKAVEHNNVFLKNVFTLLKANGFNTMPYMAILIKN
ncbi:MAG: flagellin lysine-N-methylase [Anaeromusa sp.]|uniref:flagellin lysine-N-methylase n=1 Tax=Anaeromusa sp. TaxID=1872520 RepID=UPI002B206FE6|nr:flagellin lysine-N-methylase [Anaeromusa sp.]MEA4835985.1 flagellin lysine-N-methylase [Anaeromusa sp.]